MINKYCLALDLKEDPRLISEYESYHKNVWPEITSSLKESGILDMEIYRTGNRLFMIMQVGADFSFENKSAMDAANPKVQEWETLMSRFQKPMPNSKPGEKWILMEPIYKLAP